MSGIRNDFASTTGQATLFLHELRRGPIAARSGLIKLRLRTVGHELAVDERHTRQLSWKARLPGPFSTVAGG
jgi:hypothetical protein